MSRAIDQAIFDRLEEVTGLPVFAGGEVVGQPSRYVVVWVNSGARSSDRYTQEQANVSKTYTVHSVGSTMQQAGWVNDHVLEQLIDFRPTVDGWSFQRLKHAASRPAQIDRDVNPPLAYLVDQFDLYGVPTRSEA
jgi:hypothetical protein